MDADDEIHRRIGRNLLLFQRAEHSLKALSINSKITVDLNGDPTEDFTKNTKRIGNETLGQVTNNALGTFYQAVGPEDFSGTDPEPGISILSAFAFNEPFASQHRQSLEDLVRERNEFIHRLYPKLMRTFDNHDAISQELDEQHERFAPLIETLESQYRSLLDLRHKMASILNSEEARELWHLDFFRSSPIVQQLGCILDRIADKDGWAHVSEAVRGIEATRKSIREELERCEKKSLSELLLATQLFELKLEPCDSGATRMLFRRTPERKLEKALSYKLGEVFGTE